ncbi:ribonuclease H-like domain-containing protein, partial [Mycena maculata]
AVEVIKWFDNHGMALDLLRSVELTTLGHWLALILPVVTRWVSQYCALRRLKKLERAVRACVITHEERLLVCGGRKEGQMEKAADIVKICKDNDFWKNIDRIATHIEPLAIASNILQALTCRLDTVLICLGNLLQRRWAKTDQGLMILAVFFNPYIRSHAFDPDSVSCMDMFHIVRRAYERLLRQDAGGDIEFMSAFQSYYDNQDYFSADATWIEGHRQAYEATKRPIDLIPLWKQLDGGSSSLTGRSGFVKLAIRILSMLPNSAGPERIFSFFGLTHTRHRNRLGPSKVHDTTIVRNDRQKAHIEAGMVYQRRARRFSLAEDREEESASDATPVLTPEIDIDFNTLADALVDLAAGEVDDDSEPLPPPPPQQRSP